MWSMTDYVFHQVLWIITVTAQLIAAMGTGAKWMIMTVRCVSFALLDMIYFIPNVFWYMASPNIIRRVAYRSSRKTKLRNLERFVIHQSQLHRSTERSPSLRMDASATDQDGGSAATREGGGTLARSSPALPTAEGGPATSATAATQLLRRRGTTPNAARSTPPNLTLNFNDVGAWASNLNPADNSFVNGLPMNIAEDLSHSHSLPSNSFDESLAALQKLYLRRQQQQQQAASAATPGSGGGAGPTSSSTAAGVCGGGGAARSSPGPGPLGSGSRERGTPDHPPGTSFDVYDEDDSYNDSTDTLTDSEAEDEEDKQNLHNRATLDIYLPVPLDSLNRFMDQEKKSMEKAAAAAAAAARGAGSRRGKSAKHAIGTPHRRLQRKKFPIVISVNGGAWIIGCYLWNFLVARVFAARGYVVFTPDYRNFPQTTLEGMTLDVSDAIAWVLNNAERYNGDLNDVTLMGQSAGAHLTMMSLLSQAQMFAYDANGHGRDGTPPPSDVAYNVRRYNPRQCIHRYIGLSGIYNVRGLVRHFDRRGLYRDVLYQIAGGRSQMSRYSLNCYFDPRRKADTGEVLPDNFFDFLPQEMYFVHGDADKSAPVRESANLVYVMRNDQRDRLVKAYERDPNRAKHGPKPVELMFILVPGATHTDSIIEEPLCCHNSHVVEFLELYCRGNGKDQQQQQHQQDAISRTASTSSPHLPSSPMVFSPVGKGSHFLNNGPLNSSQLGDSVNGSGIGVTGASSTTGGGGGTLPPPPLTAAGEKSEDEEEAQYPVIPSKNPDLILMTPIPQKDRHLLVRLGSWVNPF